MKKYFFLIYPEESHLRTLLDSIRIIVDPSQKNSSHITVKGPYRKKVAKIFKKDNENIAGKKLRIQGPGCFFNENQNTVFLSCVKTIELEDIWRSKKEKSYKEFHPHLTIYNGSDRHLAQGLLEILTRHKLNFEFKVNALSLYESKSSTSSLFNLHSRIDFCKLSEITQFDLNEERLQKLDTQERLDLVERLCSSLSRLSG